MASPDQHAHRAWAHEGTRLATNFHADTFPSSGVNYADAHPPTLIHRFQHDNSILALAVTKGFVFAGTQSGEILIYSLHTFERVQVVQAHNSSVLSLCLSEDELLLFSGGADRFVNVWETKDIALKHVACLYSLHDIGDIYCVVHSSRLGYLYFGMQNTTIQWYNFSNYKSHPVPDPQSHPSVRQDRFFDSTGPSGARTPHRHSSAPNGPHAHVGRTLEIEKENVKIFAHYGFVYCMLLAKKTSFGSAVVGHETLISGGSDGNIKLWKLDEDKTKDGKIEMIGELNDGTEDGHAILSMGLDGTLLYSGRARGEVNVWDLETKQLLRVFHHSDQHIMALSIGNGLLFTSDVKGKVKEYNQSYDCLNTWNAHDGKVLASVFTKYHNRPMFVTGANDDTIAIWYTGDSAPLPPSAFRASQEHLLDSLREFISYRTVSSDPRLQVDCRKGASYLRSLLKSFGAVTDLIKTADNYNPIVYARFSGNPRSPSPKKTTLFYGHYDVIPAENQRKMWKSDPFTMTGMNGYVYGRGTSDNKGPIIAAIYAVAEIVSHRALEQDIVFLIEGEEESGSRGFKDAIRRNKDLIGSVDWILLANSYWITDEVPCLTYGLRGVVHADLEVRSGEPNLHSGVDGSLLLDEPLKDLCALIAKLNGPHGQVQIPGFYDAVPPVTSSERALYDEISKYLLEGDPSLGTPESLTTSLMARWRDASMTVHGFRTSGPNNTTIIPGAALVSLSFRLVPNQEVDTVTNSLVEFLRAEFAKMESKNELIVTIKHTADPWLGDYTNIIFKTLEKVVTEVWSLGPPRRRASNNINTPKPNIRSPVATSATLAQSMAIITSEDDEKETLTSNSKANSPTVSFAPQANGTSQPPQKPLYIREGGSIPAVRFLEREFNAPAAHLPCGQASDNAHLDNERFRVLNLWNSKEIFRRVFLELPKRANVPALSSPETRRREMRAND